MKLFLIEQIQGADYDEYEGFIIRTTSHKKARKIASTNSGDEGKEIWLNPLYSSCKVIKENGPEETIMESFRAA